MAENEVNRYREVEERPPRSGLALLGLAIAVVAALVVILAGPLSRIGLWEFGTGFQILKWGSYLAIAGAVIGILGVLRSRPLGPRRGMGLAILAIVIGLVVAYVPWSWKRKAETVPPIHDITTDTINPPAFVAVLPLRSEAPNPPQYGGDSIAQQQKEAYPEVQPLALDLPPEQAFARAFEAAREMGWEIVSADARSRRIEATDTTFWFGFKDDIVVRVAPAAGGSRIDVRSVSRVGRSDVGTNATRIKEYLAKVREST
ncbi:MAG: DUF1499 domain-containing protein [Gemmatimonadota bacterium]